MSTENEIDQLADKLAKSTETIDEKLLETVKKLGPAGLKKALPQLSDAQKEILKPYVAELAKSMTLDTATITSPVVNPKVVEGRIQEEHADDEQDEKIAQAAKNEGHRNQGGAPVEGWEGQVIKSEESMDAKEFVKSLPEDKQQQIADIMFEKGVSQEQVNDIFGKAMTKKEASKKIMDMEEREHGTKDPKKLVDAEKKEHAMKKGQELKAVPNPEEGQTGSVDQMTDGKVRGKKDGAKDLEIKAETKADQVQVSMKKSVVFEDSNKLLKARTGGRNHHFSVNDFYDESLKKSQEAPKTEEFKKSEKPSINDIIEKGQDCSADEVKGKKMLADNKAKINGKMAKSFVDKDLADAFGMTEEEVKKILGE